MMENIFDDDYTIQEIDDFQAPEFQSDDGRIKVVYRALEGRVDDYLNSNFRAGEIESPIFSINDRIWMSLTPMEIQSNHLPIQRATGRVATAGLGLGYFAIRVAEKPEVESVDVYEHDDGVISYFRQAFGDRPEFKKITIIQGDVRELLPARDAEPYDYLYVDIYNHMCSESVFKDMATFMLETTCAKDYSFWGQERFLLDALRYGFDPELRPEEREFFLTWEHAELPTGRGYYSDLYRPLLDEDFISDGIRTLEEVVAKQRRLQAAENACSSVTAVNSARSSRSCRR